MNWIKRIRKSSGFTLVELLVVIVVIGILATLTIPRFLRTTTRAKETEAKLMLREIYNLERAHYLENDMYSPSFESIGFDQERLVTDGGNARYRIEITTVSDTGFIATATSVVDFDKDGTFNIWSINHKNELIRMVSD